MSPLPATTLGRTGLSVTPVGLGLAALGRPAYITLGRDHDIGTDRDETAMERRTHRVLDAAYAAGVRYFDVARSYGRAEQFLASWLDHRHIQPGTVTVGSKWGYRYTGDWRVDAAVHETKDHSLAMFQSQLPESIALLGDHLRLYQVHSATVDSGIFDDRAVLGALAELAGRGVTVGLSVSGPRQAAAVRSALGVRVEGVSPFASVQATWNLLEPSVGGALNEAHGEGWGVIVKEAVANGRLAPVHESGPEPLAAVARRHGVPVDQIAMAAALDQPWSDVVLSGAVSEEQLVSNIAALSVTLDDEDRDRLTALAEESEGYWRRRSALPWH